MKFFTFEKLKAISDLIRLRKQYGTLLLMLPTLWSLVIAAKGRPSLRLIFIFVLGSFLMRSAGCVINDIADRNFDGQVQRTKDRPLASGRMTVSEAIIIFLLLLLSAFGLALMLNPLCVLLSFMGLGFAMIYPFMKRYISIPQFFMGVAFGWGAILAWAAVHNKVGPAAVLIFIATVFWAMAYDTIYALMDIEDDIQIGLKSSAIFFGKHTWLAVAVFLLMVCVLLIFLGLMTGLGGLYYFSLAIITVLFSYQVLRIRKGADSFMAFRLFKSNVGVGILILAGIVSDYSSKSILALFSH